MAVVSDAAVIADAFEGSSASRRKPVEDSPEVVAVLAAAATLSDNSGNATYEPKADGRVVIGRAGITGDSRGVKLTTIWTPGSGTPNQGTYTGLEWRAS
jgi:hypothetical protein